MKALSSGPRTMMATHSAAGRWRRGTLWGAACLALGLAPRVARAHPGPRAPAVFEDTTCMEIVDLAESSTYHIHYSLEWEEPELGPDEVEDGRRHQFFAFRKQFRGLPTWVSWADVERAEATSSTLVDPMPIDADEVLETHSEWPEDQWVRITPDDARLPILNDTAAAGVDWDVESAGPGNYHLNVLTWDPPTNVWWPRKGLIKVIDSRQEATPEPSAFLDYDLENIVAAGESYEVTGCIDAPEGSRISVWWALSELRPEDEVRHLLFADRAVDSGPLHFDFETQDEVFGSHVQHVRFYLELTDPEGRSVETFNPNPLIVNPTPGKVDAEPDSAPEDDEDSGGGDESGMEEDTQDPDDDEVNMQADEDPDAGCACGTTPRSSGSLWLGLLFPLAGAVRRRLPQQSRR